jgi:hypothetical protein
MKRLSGIIAGLVAVALTVFGCAYVPPQGEGWISLFDGTNLNNWTRVGGANWTLQAGVVHAEISTTKGDSYLLLKNSYKDFDLRVEFWVSHDANSGIFLRCSDVKNVTDLTCYEVQIYDQRPDPSYGTGAIRHLAQVKPMPKAGGQWNVYEIRALGPELTVKLNGNVTVYARDSQHTSGPIALQWGAGIVRFRKVDIKPL